ncbi:bifunctional methylenetetrahydrofolate dehydrogenase/methenyltetrahydrofolate cyclohydrolase FolD [Lichenihabitans sp. Uapishka_5]|uniref:bifunctional methylenetetrahydrofolate dehydrogenase/methenyltetrahydrofolate cyclohydrolase FolD n=1 Tax=Lichenihabitans sp. Uapishka_5 TaxID=3037302 RepID=UPI0029E82752|nr:bifunctional methylenetetrahydrofolate dehydrogenase/methenyltetrahydrofolate cyclohydrolase FolD [Lichenihabitans sp. Uapishka_5]MDX7950955.1 bifunctional methylenetetrahydrofolate dehydrogenase/methenyltetrahydrofolate cyclohydrolase FolD [Lichenihabitans sp. Uapishka_5]
MTAQLIDGKASAAALIARIATDAALLLETKQVRPGLAVVIVGDDPASQVYVANKSRTAERCGFHSVQHTLGPDTSEVQLLALVAKLNADPAIHGILVQLPLPKQIAANAVIRAIDPAKDVDGFHDINAGRIASGAAHEAFVPCTPAGAMILIREVLGEALAGKNAVVVGRSNIVGKPMASLLLAADCTVTIAHSRTADLPAVCRGADILVAAVGRPELIRGDWVKPGAVVVDVGINRLPAAPGEAKGRLVGDVAFDEVAAHAAAITPVPGGVGPMTIALLMLNTLTSACRHAGVAI